MTHPRHFSGWLLATALAWLLTACAVLQVTTDYDELGDFSGYGTFFWMGPDTRPMKMMEQMDSVADAVLLERLQRAIITDLDAKGFRLAPKHRADLLIAFHLGAQHPVDVSDLPYRRPHGWGSKLYTTHYPEGTLVIDIIDSRQRQLIWRGTVADILDGTVPSKKALNQAISEIMADFPPPPPAF